MSIKKKKPGLVISWQKPFSVLTPWRKGKGDRDAVLNNEVVLTKMKVFNNFRAKPPLGDDSFSTISSVSVSDQDIMDPITTSEAISSLQKNLEHRQAESGSEYLSGIFLDSQLPRLYKFESEDSGVELPSGANSPSTPTGSEQSFVVHSRESSCISCNLNSDPTFSPHKLVNNSQNSDIKEVNDFDESLNTLVDAQNNMFKQEEDFNPSSEVVKLYLGNDMDQSRASGVNLEQLEGAGTLTERTCSERKMLIKEPSTGTCEDKMDNDTKVATPKRSSSSDSLKVYMDECCRLSEATQQNPSPLGSGLGYLEHICQLLEKIGHLQELNLQLQRQLCSLEKDGRMAKTKEEFFQQQCSCGAATLSYQKRSCRSEFLSPSGTFSDLSTIPEVSRHSLMPTRRDMSSESLTTIPLWRRSLNRRSYTEGEDCFLGDNTDGLSTPQRRLSENYTWGRVKDIMRKSKFKNPNRLGLTSSSLKMSCPQLYRPDLDPMEPAATNRNSMIALRQQSKVDFWIP